MWKLCFVMWLLNFVSSTSDNYPVYVRYKFPSLQRNQLGLYCTILGYDVEQYQLHYLGSKEKKNTFNCVHYEVVKSIRSKITGVSILGHNKLPITWYIWKGVCEPLYKRCDRAIVTNSLHRSFHIIRSITSAECQATVGGGNSEPRMAPMAYSRCALTSPASLYHRCAQEGNTCTYLSNIHGDSPSS